MDLSAYEMVIGLEVHAELATKTKIFCDCPTAFGAEPNTQCCPVCMGMPGTLPVLNRQVVRYAAKAGMALNCTVAAFSKQDRKNYFYPDLPKAYQISQYDLPLCEHGYLDIETKSGKSRIGITRIHIEEDAGKLIHKEDGSTLCDYNRCGVPLIEIVSEPDIRSAEEAVAYVQKLRAILLYAGVSDCRMQEGSLRCDVNLSVRRKGEQGFGVRTEMKNLNSFQSIAKAVSYEFARQAEAVETGEGVVQETRRYDQQSGKTFSMRRKENANDYRYFPDPDLVPIVLDGAVKAALLAEIPALPDVRKEQYAAQYGLSAYDAQMLVMERAVADSFEAAAAQTKAPKLLANLLLSSVPRLPLQDGAAVPVAPAHLAKLADFLADGAVGSSAAKKVLAMLWEEDRDPEAAIAEQGLWQINGRAELEPAVRRVLAASAQAAADYRRGKKAALEALVGKVIRDTDGRANPAVVRTMLCELLDGGA